jgi:MoxR-like ATPase
VIRAKDDDWGVNLPTDVSARTDGGPDLRAVAEVATGLAGNLSTVIRGKPEALRLTLVALLSGHHLLLEDVPGVGKTLLAKALARSLHGTFGRIQGTPDLLPAELTGVSVFHKDTEEWEFRPGPIFANVVLVDEINRATPRTQSALLEAMEERQVTVDGQTWPLPEPFFVVATQNPVEHAGTFPLVEGQRDRFGLVVELGHPHRAAERELLLGAGGIESLEGLRPVCGPDELKTAIAAVRTVFCAPTLADYVIDLCAATRAHPDVLLGASARASISLVHAAKAYAALAGRHYVTPDDIQGVAAASLAHRLLLAGGTDLPAATALVRRLVDSVPVPRG